MIRVACYIDGFNFYHVLDDMSRASRGAQNYLKWVNLKSLMEVFTDRAVHQIVVIKYFSVYATWKPGPYSRHLLYVKALKHYGIEIVLGRFKEKDIYCRNCHTTFKGHEEKESDVNLAIHLIGDAYEDRFDHAFIVTRDSDLAGPLRAMKSTFPKKRLKIIAPPKRSHSKELWALANTRADIKEDHLKACLLPAEIQSAQGTTICTRPVEYSPPA